MLSESHWRNRKAVEEGFLESEAVEEIGKPLKKIFSDFSEIGKPLKKIEFWAKKIKV